jgi:ABC-type multidrug transport system fused ATPase/permease subunit
MVKKNIFIEISRKHIKWIILCILSNLILTEALVYGNSIIGTIADNIFENRPSNIRLYLFKLIVLTVIGFIVAYLGRLGSSYFSTKVQSDFRTKTIDKLLNIEYKYFDKKSTGSILNNLTLDIGSISYLFSETIPSFIESFITVLVISVYIMSLNIKLFLVVVLCYPLLLVASNKLSLKLGELTKKKLKKGDTQMSIAFDIIQGIHTARSFNLNNIFMKKMNKVIFDILENEKIRTRISTTSMLMANLISFIPSIVCYLFALYEVLNNNLTLGSMFIFSILLNRVEKNLRELPFIFNDFREKYVSINRINEIINSENEKTGTYIAENKISDNIVIDFKNVNFSYGKSIIFNNLSFKIEKNKTTAFVGSSGQGKTTAFKIMCGFYKINDGNYNLYGKNFDKLDLKSARKQFSLVSQSVFLLPETIRENVSYGKIGASMNEIIEACKNANIHDFIVNLPDGYETYVGERGIKLSGGEKQRISIARAFLKNAPILLLDEPTSAIDIKNENAIKEAITKVSKGKTVIIIAHRLNTIVNSDKILLFSKGTITESGTHSELLNNKSEYALLYGKQNNEA